MSRPPAVPGAGTAASRLVLLRHGESQWNAKNLFTGWANPDLTRAGERDAGHRCRRGRDGDADIAALTIPNGIPLLYELGPATQPLSSRYLRAS